MYYTRRSSLDKMALHMSPVRLADKPWLKVLLADLL